MKRKPDTLIIDFGGVMTTNLFDAMRSFAVRESLPQESVVDLLTSDEEGAHALAALERGDASQHEFEVVIGKALGVSPEDLVPRILADLKPDPLMLTAIESIRARGNKVVVLSNTWGLEPHNPYEPYELDSRADAVIYSEVVHLRKPDPEIFRIAVESVNAQPQSCIFVDDVAHNLPSAEKMGMRVIHHVNSMATIKLLTDAYAV